MIKTKPYVDEQGIEHPNLIETYSDANLPIGEKYTFRRYEDGIAIDPIEVHREYYEIEIEEVLPIDPIEVQEAYNEDWQDNSNDNKGE